MLHLTIYEIIGYTASVLVAISLMMSSILKLRIINLIGAVIFTVYGLLIHAFPVTTLNFFIVIIDLYFLIQIFGQREYFTLLEIPKDSKYLIYFLKFYAQEIKKFQPDFKFNPAKNLVIFFVLRNMVPAGLFISEVQDTHSLFVTLDFVIPGYRDFKIGKYVYHRNSEFFISRGFDIIYTHPGGKVHEQYLRRVGFSPFTLGGERCFLVELGLGEKRAEIHLPRGKPWD